MQRRKPLERSACARRFEKKKPRPGSRLREEIRAVLAAPKPATQAPRLCASAALSLEQILNAVCAAAGIPLETVLSGSRKQEIVKARHVYAWIAYHFTGAALQAIGDTVGLTDHTSIIHARRQVGQSVRIGDGFYFPALAALPSLLTDYLTQNRKAMYSASILDTPQALNQWLQDMAADDQRDTESPEALALEAAHADQYEPLPAILSLAETY